MQRYKKNWQNKRFSSFFLLRRSKFTIFDGTRTANGSFFPIVYMQDIAQPFVIASTGNRLHLCDEAIEARQQFFKMTIGLEYVSMVVCFQMIPVVSQSEIADSIKSLFCLIGISNNQTSALQCLNLLCQRHRFFGISHVYIQKMSRWVRCSYGKRAGFVGAKIVHFLESTNNSEDFLLKYE